MAFIFSICLGRSVDELKEVDIALQAVDERMIFELRRTCAYIRADDIKLRCPTR